MTIRAYVTVLSFGMHLISSCVRYKLVLVSTVTPSLPCARGCSSFDIAGTHRSFKAGPSMIFVYLVMVSFVIG